MQMAKKGRARKSLPAKHGVANGLVRAFCAPVLMGRVGSGELHIVVVLHKEVVHRPAFAQFAALVEADILVLAGISLKSGILFDNPEFQLSLCEAIVFWLDRVKIISCLA
jgi:hypothetical protein